MMSTDEHIKDLEARRTARRVGLKAHRLRGKNLGTRTGYALLDSNGQVVNGTNFDLTADTVIELCHELMTADVMIPGARRAA
jgi:hypothetical protein